MGIKERAIGGHLGWLRGPRHELGPVQPALQLLGWGFGLEHRRSPTLLIISFSTYFSIFGFYKYVVPLFAGHRATAMQSHGAAPLGENGP